MSLNSKLEAAVHGTFDTVSGNPRIVARIVGTVQWTVSLTSIELHGLYNADHVLHSMHDMSCKTVRAAHALLCSTPKSSSQYHASRPEQSGRLYKVTGCAKHVNERLQLQLQ